MTYQPDFSSLRQLRTAHVALNPVTGLYEKFIALDSANLERTTGTPQTFTTIFSTKPSTNNQGPDGTSTATMVQNDTNNVYHGCSFATYDAPTAGQTIAWSVIAKAGTLSKVKCYAGSTSQAGVNTTVIASFDLTDGSTLSAHANIKIRPVGGDNPAYAGWYEIYTVGITGDGTMGPQFVIHLLNSSGTESYTGNTSQNFYVWKFGVDKTNKDVGRIFTPTGVTTNAFQQPTAAEVLVIGIGSLSTPQAMSVFMEWIDRGNAVSGISPGIFRLGDMVRTAQGSLELIQSSSGFTATYQSSAGTSVSTAALVPAVGDLVGALVTIDGTGACQLTVYNNSNSAVVGTAGTARSFDGTWSDNLLTINSAAGLVPGDMYLSGIALIPGVRAISRLRGRLSTA